MSIFQSVCWVISIYLSVPFLAVIVFLFVLNIVWQLEIRFSFLLSLAVTWSFYMIAFSSCRGFLVMKRPIGKWYVEDDKRKVMFYWCILGGCLCIVYFPCVLFCFSGDFQSCSKPVEKLNEKKAIRDVSISSAKPSWPTGGTNRNRKLRIPSGIGLENPIIKGEREAEAAGGRAGGQTDGRTWRTALKNRWRPGKGKVARKKEERVIEQRIGKKMERPEEDEIGGW